MTSASRTARSSRPLRHPACHLPLPLRTPIPYPTIMVSPSNHPMPTRTRPAKPHPPTIRRSCGGRNLALPEEGESSEGGRVGPTNVAMPTQVFPRRSPMPQAEGAEPAPAKAGGLPCLEVVSRPLRAAPFPYLEVVPRLSQAAFVSYLCRAAQTRVRASTPKLRRVVGPQIHGSNPSCAHPRRQSTSIQPQSCIEPSRAPDTRSQAREGRRKNAQHNSIQLKSPPQPSAPAFAVTQCLP